MTIVGVGVRMTPFKGWVEAGGEEIHLSNIMFMFFFFFFFLFKMRNIHVFPLSSHQDLQFDTKHGYLLRLTPNDPIWDQGQVGGGGGGGHTQRQII